MLKELEKIFKYYRKKYKLKTELIFEEDSEQCGIYPEENYIVYDLNYVANDLDNSLIHQFDEYKKLIYCLLHEIGHAIDWKYNKNNMKKEMNEKIDVLYFFDVNYALSMPFEKRANNFAKKELKKWIK